MAEQDYVKGRMGSAFAEWLAEPGSSVLDAPSDDCDPPWEDHTVILEHLKKRVQKYTPDYLERKLEGQIPIFLYGSMKHGGIYDDLTRDIPSLGKAVTTSTGYELLETSSGTFPIMVPAKGSNPLQGRIRGEVCVANPLDLLQIDKLENNLVMYKRTKIWVTLLDQKYETVEGSKSPVIEAWAYFGVSEYWKNYSLNHAPFETIGKTVYFNYPVKPSYKNSLTAH